jgi:hypothetical protein
VIVNDIGTAVAHLLRCFDRIAVECQVIRPE